MPVAGLLVAGQLARTPQPTDATPAVPTPATTEAPALPATPSPEMERAAAPLTGFLTDLLLDPRRVPDVAPAEIDDETLWLARCIYSETKRPREQELVAWVVRNRVETGYRGQSSYRDVVLDPYQFSAFNPESPRRGVYLGLEVDDSMPGWQRALQIAHHVRHADGWYRPFSRYVRHFYSEQSMVGSPHPAWAEGQVPVKPGGSITVEPRRFRFFKGIS